MLTVKQSGDFRKMEVFLTDVNRRRNKIISLMRKYGELGVDELTKATPMDTGVTASSWRYALKSENNTLSLQWLNDSLSDDGETPVVILLVYGHGNKDGSYVAANNFVTPAIKPIMDALSIRLMKEV